MSGVCPECCSHGAFARLIPEPQAPSCKQGFSVNRSAQLRPASHSYQLEVGTPQNPAGRGRAALAGGPVSGRQSRACLSAPSLPRLGVWAARRRHQSVPQSRRQSSLTGVVPPPWIDVLVALIGLSGCLEQGLRSLICSRHRPRGRGRHVWFQHRKHASPSETGREGHLWPGGRPSSEVWGFSALLGWESPWRVLWALLAEPT